VYECQWVQFFPHERIQWHTFSPSMLLCQIPFCQTVPLLPSVTQKQNVMEYWWESSSSTAIPPTSDSEDVDQDNKRRSIAFQTAFLDVRQGVKKSKGNST